jgi:L-2-hydroxycarboxylate dehydrogenase (NAD+)
VQIEISELHRICIEVLTRVGVPSADAAIVADSIVDAHRRGKGTHGVGRLPIYVRKIRSGLMAADTPLELVRQSGAIAIYDAHHGFGQVAGFKGMEAGIALARQHGVGVVGIRHSNNFGAAGFVAEVAAASGFLGVVLGNSAPAMPPTGGTRPLLGTNPLAISFPPGSSGFPITLDMATSMAARGKIRLAAKNGESIPIGWAIDATGLPTSDPHAALRGSMLPLGGAKGYGLALAIDILAGLLPGAAFAGDVRNLADPTHHSNYGHLLVAVDPSAFMAADNYVDAIDLLTQRVKACGTGDEILLPGERGHRRAQKQAATVEVSDAVASEVSSVLAEMAIESTGFRHLQSGG